MFNIVSIIIFGLIVFFMNTSLPFLYFFYIFFNVLLFNNILHNTLSNFVNFCSIYTSIISQKFPRFPSLIRILLKII